MGTQWYSGDSGGKWHMWVMCHFSVILTVLHIRDLTRSAQVSPQAASSWSNSRMVRSLLYCRHLSEYTCITVRLGVSIRHIPAHASLLHCSPNLFYRSQSLSMLCRIVTTPLSESVPGCYRCMAVKVCSRLLSLRRNPNLSWNTVAES